MCRISTSILFFKYFYHVDMLLQELALLGLMPQSNMAIAIWPYFPLHDGPLHMTGEGHGRIVLSPGCTSDLVNLVDSA